MANLPDKVQQSLGIIPGTKFFSPYPFSGMNVQSIATSIDDREFVYNENFIHLGDGKLRTAWDIEASIYSPPSGTKIVSFFFYNIGSTYYAAVFNSDGSAVQVNLSTLTQTTIGILGTFYVAGGALPVCCQWGTIYLLIANRNTVNDYWIWDGSILYKAGTAAPNGVNLNSTGIKYTINPTITTYGGNGSGMTFIPTVQAGGVVNIQISNPGTGYEVGDIVQLAFSGGGSDTSAILQAVLNAGAVSAVNVTAPGLGYTAATVAFTGGGGTGAAGTVQIGNGVTSLTVTAGGTGYTSGAAVAFSGGGGSGASATAATAGGVVTGLTIVTAGTGYTSAPTVTITGAGTGATATATVQNGVITGVKITNAGAGYTSAPTVTFSGTGTGATGVAVLNPASVSSVNVVNGGSGFIYAPNITFVGGGGTGAAGIVNLTGTSIAQINVVAGGVNYTAPPTISFFGGGTGSGAAAVPIMAGGAVVGITLTNAGSGYSNNVEVIFTNAKSDTTGNGAGADAILVPTSIASVTISNYGLQYTDAPAIEIQSGANNSAYATVSLMPFGVSGSAMETYQSRVWIANPDALPYGTIPPGGDFQVSAPGSLTDFATSDGGVLFTSSDGFLQTRYVGFKQSNGYLYPFGDGSISVISSVNTSGSPSTTTFNYQTVDPQSGLSWRDTMQAFGRTIIFGNETGVFGLYGGAATKVSDKMNDIFDTAIFPPNPSAVTPSSAVSTMHAVKHYLMNMTFPDPESGIQTTRMIAWNEKEWFTVSQTKTMTYIGSQKVDSLFTAWGTDGLGLYPMFQTPSATLPKRLFTKYYGGGGSSFIIKDLGGMYMMAQDQSVGASGINCQAVFVISGLAVQPSNPDLTSVPNGIVSNLMFANPVFPAPKPYWPLFGVGCGGAVFVTVGLELTTQSPDFILGGLMIAYRDQIAAM